MNWKLKQRINEVFGSQVKFSYEVQEPETLVSKVVRGWRNISPEKQKKWAKALGCKPKDVFDG